MERLMGFSGLLVMLGIAFLFSTNRRAIRPRTVLWGLGLQFGLALLVLKTTVGRETIKLLARFVDRLLRLSEAGSQFLFGALGAQPTPESPFYFAFQVLPTIIFIAALFAILYYYGIMQAIIRALAKVMTRLMGTSGAESLNAAAAIFMGQTESPLTIRPYLNKLTQSELMAVMTAGMATVSGAILAAYIRTGVSAEHVLTAVAMAAPAAVYLAKIFVPETETPMTAGVVRLEVKKEDANVLGAAARGTTDGLHLAINVAAMLISFLALLALVNLFFELTHTRFAFFPESLQQLLGWVFSPLAWLMGVPWSDATQVGGLMGLRMVTNEIVAFQELVQIKQTLDPRSLAITTFALCGFANMASIGIQIGGLGALAPDRRGDLARLGFRAMIAGTLANFTSAAIAGILL
ncbi:NupC/NupG family nucleoside CNT transporter [Acidobacteriia bacterium AH_259_A11_L15]|nr:NupC/NupG family nucleoside CNT transporter [Acidobacteriia bacterium AH_259_A11_L15]